VQGRLSELTRALSDDERCWGGPEITLHWLFGLILQDQVPRARELFDRAVGKWGDQCGADVRCHVEAWLLMAEGDPVGALAGAEQAVRHSRRTGIGFAPIYQIAQARALLLLGRADEAEEVLEDALALCRRTGFLAYVEWAEMLLGRVRLLRNDLDGARELLSSSVSGMQQAARLLYLPMAAMYLADAERRLGHRAAASDAMDLAYRTVRQTGAHRVLKDAVGDCPAELCEQRVEEGWSASDGGLHVQRLSGPRTGTTRIAVEVQPFDPSPDIILGGVPQRVRRLKVLELACLLVSHPDGYSRHRAQLCLFPDSDQRRGGNHFRQVVHQLRKLTGVTLDRLPSDRILWSSQFQVTSRDLEFEQALAEARTLLPGTERLRRLQEVLPMVSGDFLPASNLEWVTSRRFELEVLQEEAETEAATLSLELGEHAFARECAESILTRNPYSDVAYQVLISVEMTIGNECAALALYRQAVAVRREIGLGADPAMAALLERAAQAVPGVA